MTKALSLTVFAELSKVTDGRTDGRTDRIGITIGDLMLRADALASVAKSIGDTKDGNSCKPGIFSRSSSLFTYANP